MDIRFKGAIIVFFIVLHFCWFCPFVAETKAENGEKEDILQRMIELVVEVNPTLVSQNRILQQSENLPEPWPLGTDNIQIDLTGGYGTQLVRRGDDSIAEFFPSAGINITLPIFNPSRWQVNGREQFEIEVIREEVKQKYLTLKNSVISELLGKVSKISELENEKDNLQKLKIFLEDQSKELKRQIESGVAPPRDLWILKERIVKTDTEIRKLSNLVRTVRRETAVNLGGEKWGELLSLLESVGLDLPGK